MGEAPDELYLELRAQNAVAAAAAAASNPCLPLHTPWVRASPIAEQSRTRNAAKTYLGGADTAVLVLLKGRGSGLGSLNELELALTARHTRGLGHLDDVCCQNQLAMENGQEGVGVGDRVAKQKQKGLLARCSVGPQERWSKRAEKRASSGGDVALSPPLEPAPLPIGICSHNLASVSQALFFVSREGKKARCLSWLA